MVNRLSPEAAMYYFLDGPNSSTHLGVLFVLDPGARDSGTGPLDYGRLVSLVENRLQLVPRYRQVVVEVPLGLARPLWVDDVDFDITYHVRLSALPQPGTDEQLQELIARVMSRSLDRRRPLWELNLIEGLSGGRMAVLVKSHRALVDGEANRELSEVLADPRPDAPPLPEELWSPDSRPGGSAVAMGALAEAFARPGEVADSVLRGNGPVADLLALTDRSARFVGSAVGNLVNSAPDSPLNNTVGAARLVTFATIGRDECRKVAERFECSFTDVVLGIVTGVLRRWLLSIQETVGHGETVRAVLPLITRDPSAGDDRAAAETAGWTCEGEQDFVTDLPVGEDAPAVRLMQVAGLADRYSQSTRRMTSGVRPLLPDLGIVPFADVSVRAFNQIFQRSYNVPIRMCGQPVAPRYLGGVPITDLYVLPTLLAQRALAISVVEYGDQVQFGFVADRNVLGDLPAMAGYVAESFEELVTGGFPPVRPTSGSAGAGDGDPSPGE
ncbi:wax ester/triacylglycerol synthase family O-acyltransferase [Gordonia sp. VNK21]|uniref:wax ester/triacylglycerol synthase family O-acyltransferase n=1 Tax=Gordonia sp. VNK21 TaxID=3382483 RepID=UPI0038D45FFF